MEITNGNGARAFMAAWSGESVARQIRKISGAIESQEKCAQICANNGWTEKELDHREAIGVLRLGRLRIRQAAGLHP